MKVWKLQLFIFILFSYPIVGQNTFPAIGSVGIGTDNPMEKLHIEGPVRGHKNGALRISTGQGYVDIGPKSSSSENMHFYTDKSRYYFDKEIRVASGMLGSYSGDNLYLRTAGVTRVTIANSSGYVGIGTTSPLTPLSFGSLFQKKTLTLNNTSNGWYGLGVLNNQMCLQVANTNAKFSFFAGDNDEIMTLEGDGKLTLNQQYAINTILDGEDNQNYLQFSHTTETENNIYMSPQGRLIIGTTDPCARNSNGYALNVKGEARIDVGFSDAPNFTIFSDKRLKKNIIDLKESLEKFNRVKLYEYEYINNVKGKRLGIMAQEIKEILPNSVGISTADDGKEYLNFNPSDLHFLHMKATQELSKKVDKIDALKSENEVLKERLSNVENQLNEIYIMLANNEGVTQIQATTMSQNINVMVGQNIPNPATNETIIPYFIPKNNINANLKITDINGKVMMNQKIQDSDNGNLTVNTASLPTGAYLYFITVDGKISSSRKMIIE